MTTRLDHWMQPKSGCALVFCPSHWPARLSQVINHHPVSLLSTDVRGFVTTR
jgi:hypothetical protein